MFTAVKNQMKICWLSFKYNMMREMLNKVTFLMNIVFMVLNNATFIVQWVILMNLKGSIGGYGLKDVMLLWGLAATSYGIAHVLCERAFDLPSLIVDGKLDSYLVQPKNVLISVITSATKPSAIGDTIYGYIVLLIFNPDIKTLLMFTFFSFTGGLILTSFAVLVGSLSFWIKRGEMLSGNLVNIMVSFATYPDGVFKGVVRFILYLIIPVGMANYIPVGLMREFDVVRLLIVLLYAVVIASLACFVFYRGLRRYSSGNLMSARM